MACVGTDMPCLIAGDDFYYPVQFTDSSEVPRDLTGATAKMDLRDEATNSSVVQSMSGGITDPLLGYMLFTLTDGETAALLPRAQASRVLVFSVKLTYSDNTEQTILTGSLNLEQAVTE
ncbi:MAG TPA: hypothetical protein EYN54_04820 [Methylococcaceae bacterium]|nr:hypothetical protein [Methylococcaceae bacterium]